MNYLDVLEKTRLIAILRGVTPNEVLDVSKILVNAGFKIIEVPLNSPDAIKSVDLLVDYYKDYNDVFIGGGTVCSVVDVEKLHKTNAKLVISPNTDINVISKTNELNMISIPGFLTPSEAYSAINAGAKCLKLFPFRKFGIKYYQDIKTILPKDISIIAVGGVDESNIKDYLDEGIKYFGLGSSLYKPNIDIYLLKQKAESFVKVIREHDE
ncbi:MAG: 2-dehydro-3-deoxy-6-phosphogalactonate aldolase [Arcobacter sp.]|nr:2-dehydro-3-deoxy-6-phosphogalactonate aldolase [Arcobacter sp.]